MRPRSSLLALSICLLAVGGAGHARGDSRVPLAPENALAESVAPFSLEAAGSGRIPMYLRALGAARPGAAPAFAKLVKTTLYGGTLAPSLKLAMGLRIARETKSRYLALHLDRLLRATGPCEDNAAARLALRYADDLTRSIHGSGAEDFARLRGEFNDAQIVELTLTTCFFHYFARLAQGLGLAPEPWLSQPPALPSRAAAAPSPPARVALLTDEEIAAAQRLADAAEGQRKSWGMGIANSQRAMARVPDIADAWFSYLRGGMQAATVPRTTLLQVSLAVSTLNGCRYCTLHQVQGLRRQGVEIAKLLALQKGDDALMPAEKAAVVFARKLTQAPGDVTDADFAALQKEFGEKALEVVLQTCTFAFMNRFTDGLRLPSEDEAIHIYREVYGRDFGAIPD